MFKVKNAEPLQLPFSYIDNPRNFFEVWFVPLDIRLKEVIVTDKKPVTVKDMLDFSVKKYCESRDRKYRIGE